HNGAPVMEKVGRFAPADRDRINVEHRRGDALPVPRHRQQAQHMAGPGDGALVHIGRGLAHGVDHDANCLVFSFIINVLSRIIGSHCTSFVRSADATLLMQSTKPLLRWSIPLLRWSIPILRAKAVWLGNVEAVSEAEAIQRRGGGPLAARQAVEGCSERQSML